ncbi:MAG: hypothetical protein M1812_000493 [Candelaria pacifica]|nr:MAG: hypothetical protein M1812_000493 [Candelaria pacifica]
MQHCSPLLKLRNVSRRPAAAITAAVVAGSSNSFAPFRPTLSIDLKHTQHRNYTSTYTAHLDNEQDLATLGHPNSPPIKASSEASVASDDPPPWPPHSDRHDPNAWVAYLEPFLPSNFRRSSSQSPSDVSETTQKPLEDLPHFLFQAREQFNVDVLSYMGVYQDRWQAVLWIVRNILSGTSGSSVGNNTSTRATISNPTIPWSTEDPLEKATGSAIWAERPKLNNSTSAVGLETQTRFEIFEIERSSAHVSLSQIWQSLGSMVLEAAERTKEEARQIMPHVLQIIAFLHHSDFVPDTVYKYVPVEAPLSLERPPTLHFLSSRILTALADAVWRAHESQVAIEAAAVGAQYHYLGFEVPGARYKLKVGELGLEVWMELIMWSCVDGGLVKEGAWILQQLRKRVGQKKWSVIDFKAVQQPTVGDNPKTARIDWEGINYRAGGINLGSIEGYSSDRPSVELGERTISSEVVVALIDGLVDSIRVGVGNRGNAASKILDHIFALKNILERDKFGLGANSWNQILVRILESGGIDPEVDPSILERALGLAPIYLKEFESSNAPVLKDRNLVSPNYVLEQSAVAVGLSHRVLSAYIKSSNIRGSLRAFAHLQAMTDANKKKSITGFIDKLRRQDRGIADVFDATVDDMESPMSEVPGFFPQVPLPLLASFLGLVTEAKVYEFGRWLLYADEVDGCVIPTTLYATPEMAPELLRFAAATSDGDLLERVSRALEPPLSERTLRALLHCQIIFRNWDAVETVLIYARDEISADWEAPDAAALAKAVLVLETSDHHVCAENEDFADLSSVTRAKDILKKLLHGELSPVTSPSTKPSRSRSNELPSLCQIFKTISSTLADLCPTDSNEGKVIVKLPIQAFNILLSGVVETKSSIEGKRLWDLYCKSPDPPRQEGLDAGVPRRPWKRVDQRQENRILAASKKPPAKNAVPSADDERLIRPNLSTLRIITQAAIQERQQLTNASVNQEKEISTQAKDDSTQVEPALSDQVSEPSTNLTTNKDVEENKEVLDNLLIWAGDMFRNFRVAEADIDKELGIHSHRKRKNRRENYI